jgi:hypothetical protein
MTKPIRRFATAVIITSFGTGAAFTPWFAHLSSANGPAKTDELSSLQTLNFASLFPIPE